jgi:AraC-like DNA-binding protein
VPPNSPLVSLAVLFGGVFALVFALALVVRPKRIPGDWALIGYLACAAIWDLLGGSLLLNGAQAFRFNVYAVTLPACFASVPLFYLFFRSIIDASRRITMRDAPHAIMPVVSTLVLLPSLGHPMYLYKPNGLFLSSLSKVEIVPTLANFGSGLICATYFAKLITDSVRLSIGADRASRPVLVSATCLIAVLFLGIVAWMVDRLFSFRILPWLYTLHSLVLVAIFLFGVRFPGFRTVIGEEGERVRYSRTRIANIETGPTFMRLEALMREERLYVDPKLSLEALAERLGLSPHQLSEFINARLDKSFPDFVDSYRIAEARRHLVAEPKRKILDIAFDVGFNSSSAFYAAFKKETGMTPSAFRNWC